jgi:AcrR family transcriptional regulator
MNPDPERLREAPAGRPRPPATRDEILGAALALFADRGYRGTTISAIADAVGISAPGVMHHFPTKERLFWAVVEVYTETWAGQFATMIEPGGLQAIRNLAGWGVVMEEHADLLGLQVILSAEAISKSSETHDYWVVRYENLKNVVAGLFEQGIEQGEIRPETDVAHEVSAIFAYLDGMRLQWFYTDGRQSIAAGFRRYIDDLIRRIAS